MAKQRKSIKAAANLARLPKPAPASALSFDPGVNLPAPKIRKTICGNVSAVTFWRWRHDPKMNCPPLTEVNGRLYGAADEWLAWWARQQQVA